MNRPMPDDPLPLSVELAREIARYCELDAAEAYPVALIIDGRVRPLVEALRAVQAWDSGNGPADYTHVTRLVNAALKAAGAE